MNKMIGSNKKKAKPLFVVEQRMTTDSEGQSQGIDLWDVVSDGGFLIKGPLTEEEARKLLAFLDALHVRQEDYRLGLAPQNRDSQDDSPELWVVYLGNVCISAPMQLTDAGANLIATQRRRQLGQSTP